MLEEQSRCGTTEGVSGTGFIDKDDWHATKSADEGVHLRNSCRCQNFGNQDFEGNFLTYNMLMP